MVIGVMGGIGSGKSEVLKYMQDKHNAVIIEADKIAHDILFNDEKVKVSHTGIHQVPVTVDIMGGLKWRAIGVYIRYSPCHVLKEEHAPAFTPLTVGLGLAL